GTDINMTILRVPEVAPAPGGVRMEVDLDPRGVQPRALEPRHGPDGKLLLDRVLREDRHPWPELHPRCVSCREGPAPGKCRQSEDRGSEPTDRAHGRTVEPGA